MNVHPDCTSFYLPQLISNSLRYEVMLTSSSAAIAAMAVLRSGGTSVDAIEIAVKVLEDREITNAGDRKSTRLNSSHVSQSRMPSSA